MKITLVKKIFKIAGTFQKVDFSYDLLIYAKYE